MLSDIEFKVFGTREKRDGPDITEWVEGLDVWFIAFLFLITSDYYCSF